MKFKLITGRTIKQGEGKDKGKFSDEYTNEVSSCDMDREDMEQLKIKEGDLVRIKSEFGTVVLKARESKQGPHKGMVFVPYGPYCNMLLPSETNDSGMPSLKGIEVEVEAAPGEKLKSIKEVLEALTE